jgi:secreted Zn-dependent insulinase-like peptidase
LGTHQVIKEDLERAYKNTNMKPMSHSTYLRLQFLRKIFWDVDEKRKVLATLTFSDLAEYVPKLLSQVSTTMMFISTIFLALPVLTCIKWYPRMKNAC